MSVTMKTIATMKAVAMLLAECRANFILSLGRRAPNLRCAKQMAGLVAFELALVGEVCGGFGQILVIDVHKFSRPPDNFLFDSCVRLRTRTQVFARRAFSAAVAA